MSIEAFAYERPQMTIRLERDADEGEGYLDLADQVIAAIEALSSGWLEPLAWELYAGCFDTESVDTPINPKPPQPYWMLRKKQIPAGVDVHPIYGNHTIVTNPVLRSEQFHAWVARALAQTCAGAPRFIPCWRHFDSLAMRARLPEATCSTGQQRLDMDSYAGIISVPLERIDEEVWVSGRPAPYLVGPPVAITAGNLYGLLIYLDLEVYWSPWLEQPGRATVDAAVERVLALGRGWRYET